MKKSLCIVLAVLTGLVLLLACGFTAAGETETASFTITDAAGNDLKNGSIRANEKFNIRINVPGADQVGCWVMSEAEVTPSVSVRGDTMNTTYSIGNAGEYALQARAKTGDGDWEQVESLGNIDLTVTATGSIQATVTLPQNIRAGSDMPITWTTNTSGDPAEDRVNVTIMEVGTYKIAWHSWHSISEGGVTVYGIMPELPETSHIQKTVPTGDPILEDGKDYLINIGFAKVGWNEWVKNINFSTKEAESHSWGTPTYAWAEDYSTVTAKVVCTHCGEEISETVETTYKVIKEPTYTEKGVGQYTSAAFTKSSLFEVQTKKVAIDMLPRTSISRAKVSKIKDQVYTGKALKPKVTVKLGGKTLKAGTDYTVAYENNKAVGKATVTITGKGAYKGKISKTFKILPKPTKLSSLKPGEKMITVKWEKGKGITGYEIQFSISKNFTSPKSIKVKKASTTSGKIKGLKAGKIYYVRIRTYKKAGKEIYYSSWSKAMKARVPKQ